jgi:hypothetical protein
VTTVQPYVSTRNIKLALLRSIFTLTASLNELEMVKLRKLTNCNWTSHSCRLLVVSEQRLSCKTHVDDRTFIFSIHARLAKTSTIPSLPSTNNVCLRLHLNSYLPAKYSDRKQYVGSDTNTQGPKSRRPHIRVDLRSPHSLAAWNNVRYDHAS